jgi:hypothetical protein
MNGGFANTESGFPRTRMWQEHFEARQPIDQFLFPHRCACWDCTHARTTVPNSQKMKIQRVLSPPGSFSSLKSSLCDATGQFHLQADRVSQQSVAHVLFPRGCASSGIAHSRTTVSISLKMTRQHVLSIRRSASCWFTWQWFRLCGELQALRTLTFFVSTHTRF